MRADMKQLLYTEFKDFRQNTPNSAVPNGPVCGNGDIGIVMDAVGKGVRFWLSKNDFWCYRPSQRNGGMKSPSFLLVLLGNMAGAETTWWEDGRTARIGMRYECGETRATVEAFTPRGGNVVIVRLQCEAGSLPFEVKADTLSDDPLCSVMRETREGKRLIVKRYAGEDVDRASCAATALAALNGSLSSCLEAGHSACFVAAISTDNEAVDPAAGAMELCGWMDQTTLEALAADNRCWWEAFWSASDVCLPDMPDVERAWYLSHYIMACCCDRKKFAPGIFGNFLTSDSPNWGGDYHLNYNHEAPFWGLYSSNHIELADAYDRPVLEYTRQSQENARERLNCRGLYSKVGVGPMGYEISKMYRRDGSIDPDVPYWGQKSNASYAGINFIMRYYHTLDREYLEEKAYPYLVQVIDFWEDYLVFEGGRYVDKNDCIHENSALAKDVFIWAENASDYSEDMNPILTLGLIRTTLRALLDMSATLGVDADRREKWTHMLEHLSAYPTQQREGKTVFRYTERGMDWCDSNSLGIQHIYPAGDINLDSDERLLTLARDTHTVLNRWEDYNAFPTFFTAAARLGIDPDTIITKMKAQIAAHGYENGFIYYGGGGIECCSAVPSTINDMLVQNYSGRLRLFPVWNRSHDAAFHNLRTYGALLVSARLDDGSVRDVRIICEKGGRVSLVSPWANGVCVTCRGNVVDTEVNEMGDVVFDAEAGLEYEVTHAFIPAP